MFQVQQRLWACSQRSKPVLLTTPSKTGINHRSRVYPTFHIIFYLLFTRAIGISTARWSTTLRTSVFRKINHFDGRGCKELWSTRLHDATCQEKENLKSHLNVSFVISDYNWVQHKVLSVIFILLHKNMKALQPTSFQFINR